MSEEKEIGQRLMWTGVTYSFEFHVDPQLESMLNLFHTQSRYLLRLERSLQLMCMTRSELKLMQECVRDVIVPIRLDERLSEGRRRDPCPLFERPNKTLLIPKPRSLGHLLDGL